MGDDPPVRHAAPRRDEELGGEALLESLGYKQALRRRLSFWNNVGLALADITPMGSLLIVGTVVIATAGSRRPEGRHRRSARPSSPRPPSGSPSSSSRSSPPSSGPTTSSRSWALRRR